MKRVQSKRGGKFSAVWGAIFLAVPLTIWGQVSPATALEAYRKGNYRGSEAQYSQLAKQAPDDPRLRFNAGAAAYRENDLTNAATWFESVLGAPDLKLQQKAYYNLGNARYKLGEALPDPEARKQYWSEALTNLVSAMNLDTTDTNAAANYAFVRRQLEELQQQMPPPQPQPKSGDDSQKQKQDDQKKDSQDPSSKDSKPNQDKDSSQKKSGSDKNQAKQNPAQGQDPGQDNASNSGKDQAGNQNADGSQKSPSQESGGDKKEPGEKSKPEPKPGNKPAAKPLEDSKNAGATGNAEAGPDQPGQMSATQAVQMLEAQKGDEKALLMRAYGDSKEAAQRAARVKKQW